jgi:hypothetical protein
MFFANLIKEKEMRNLWACHKTRKHPSRIGHVLQLIHDVEFKQWRVEELDKGGELYGFEPTQDSYSNKAEALKEFSRAMRK